MPTMRAIEIPNYGPPDVARLAERPVPEPGPGRVVIEVRAAAVNFSDIMIAGDFYPGHRPPTPPYIAGREASGVVHAVGQGVDDLAIGDRVIGLGLRGAFAQYVECLPATLSPAPDRLSDNAAAGFLLPHLTGLAALELAATSAGDRVLIHAGAGGVGQAALQMAKHLGARVATTASSEEKRALTVRLGADLAVDYTSSDWIDEVMTWTGGAGIDVAVDTIGGAIFEQTRAVMRPFGRLVLAGIASGETATIDRTQMISTHCFAHIPLELGRLIVTRPDLLAPLRARLDQSLADGALTVAEPTAHPLEAAAQVMTDMAARTTAGKHVLVP